LSFPKSARNAENQSARTIQNSFLLILPMFYFRNYRKSKIQSRYKVIPVIISLAETTNFMILNYQFVKSPQKIHLQLEKCFWDFIGIFFFTNFSARRKNSVLQIWNSLRFSRFLEFIFPLGKFPETLSANIQFVKELCRWHCT
jgi:hypothetical protein